MAPRRRRKDNTAQLQRFWIVVGLLCVVGGALAYQAGRHWVTGLLGDVKVEATPIKLPGEPDGAATANAGRDRTAPSEVKVVVEERDPSEAEKQELSLKALERRAARNEPQDGAQLHAAEAGERPAVGRTSQTGDFLVTAGSFLELSNAERAAADLRAKGYQPFISEYERDGLTYRRVNVGSYGSRAEADQIVDRLEEAGVAARVTAR